MGQRRTAGKPREFRVRRPRGRGLRRRGLVSGTPARRNALRGSRFLSLGVAGDEEFERSSLLMSSMTESLESSSLLMKKRYA